VAPVAVSEDEDDERAEEGSAAAAAAAAAGGERAEAAAPQRTAQEKAFQRLMWSHSGSGRDSLLPALAAFSIAWKAGAEVESGGRRKKEKSKRESVTRGEKTRKRRGSRPHEFSSSSFLSLLSRDAFSFHCSFLVS
jgi:hypothetical protein